MKPNRSGAAADSDATAPRLAAASRKVVGVAGGSWSMTTGGTAIHRLRSDPRPSLLGALLPQHDVVRALILRELQSRFGRNNIGYLWMVAEPMMLASVITLLHYFMHIGHQAPGMGPYPFTLLGYCLFIVFRNSFNRADGVIEASKSAFYHAQVTPLDLMLAKMIVETIGVLSALVILMAIGILAGVAELPARPIYVFAAICAIASWTFGLALVIAAHTTTNHVLGHLVHPFSYFMVPLSGAFVTMAFLPGRAQRVMAWNPMMAMFELARFGYFRVATDRYVYPLYILAHCGFVLGWGLLAIRRVRSHVHVG
jgi:capsular polysaccharide transport system permease protein